jgi:RNA polymerase sigma factor (sigma-70 family)
MTTLTPTIESDSELVFKCQNGDQEGWTLLLNRYKRLIYSVTVRFGFENEDRHDVFQAVCLEILRNLSSLRNTSSLRYWILTISVRQCCVFRKRLQQERLHSPDDSALLIYDPHPDTLSIYQAAERAEILRDAMEELPERCRHLLSLLFFADEKTPYTQLGGTLGCSKDTIGSARKRCLERLRKILTQKGF